VNAPRHRQKATQRERLLTAAIEIVARDEYTHSTIAKIVAAAGVSRPTFYEYFADRDACLLAAVIAINRELLSATATALEQAESSRAALLATDAIVDFCDSHPAAARVWLVECLAGAPATLDARDDGIDALAQLIDKAHSAAPPDALLPALDSCALLGGVHRLLGSRVRKGESLDAARTALLPWIESYAVPARERQSPRASLHPSLAADPTADPPFGARPLHRSQVDYPGRDPAEYQRDQIFFAASQLLVRKSLGQVTVADIAKQAGVGYRRLTALFPDKQGLFSALHELGYLRTLATTSGGYFSSDSWPDRVWSAGAAYAQYVGGNATLAHVGFVIPYSAGPASARQMDEILKAFTLFLHEGYSHVPSGHDRPSDVALEAIAATIFDLGYRKCRAGDSAELPSLLPQAVFIALAPFLGVAEAGEFVGGKVGAAEADH
jgi:AcrR family transcriptional regulator